MRKFHFTLQKLLRLREKEEEERKNDFARVMTIYQQEDLARKRCFDRIRDNTRSLEAEGTEVLMKMRFELDALNAALRNEASAHQRRMEEIEPELEKKRALLLEATKARKIVELLREKQFKRYKREMRKKETEALDEWKSRNDDEQNFDRVEQFQEYETPTTIRERRARDAIIRGGER